MNGLSIRLIALIALLYVAPAVRADEAVLSVDTDRIVTLAREAIAKQRNGLDADNLKLANITYRFDAEQKEYLRVNFRNSPDSVTTRDEGRASIRTVTTYRVVTVELDKTGNILKISSGGTAREFKAESTCQKTVQENE